ncbi:MAG: alkaline phosphatase [candidate division NC10 bacterium]|nr:alkaline phosphatase [candidate division NC10 bacterium]
MARMNTPRAVLTLVLLMGAMVVSGVAAAATAPRNVIILFADGIGTAHVEIARLYNRHIHNAGLTITDVIMRQGSLGLMTSHPVEAIATDSAAAGSAMFTGIKTTIGTISMTPDGKPARTVAEAARAAGKRVGIVTTATVYDASPAAFSVHAKSRRDTQAIVDQYLTLGLDVILGGGRDFFLPTGTGEGNRKDGKDLIAAFRGQGYSYAATLPELKAATAKKLLGLFAWGGMAFEIDRDPAVEPSIRDMTEAALRTLAQDSPNGFVVLLETENTDTAAHRNDIAALVHAVREFDAAVKIAYDFYSRAPNETLLIVTSDHETGGLTVTYAQTEMTTSGSKRFYAAPEHLKLVSGITVSLDKARDILGKKPDPAALDALVRKHFPGFTLDADLREAILGQKMLERNCTYPTQCALGRMVARQTGIYWGTSGHSAQPVFVAAVGPGSDRFQGYMDNTEFGKALLGLLDAR